VDMIGTVLPLAIVIGLSPLPIMPAILLLMTPRARANGWAFLGAWLVGLTLLVLVTVLLGWLSGPDEATDQGIGWIQLITGLAFLGLAALKWARRPRAGEPAKAPGWLAALNSYAPRQSARLGGALAAGNPKNIAMALAAGAEIAYLAEGAGAVAVGVMAFLVVGSVGVATPILLFALVGERARPGLERGRVWLERNSTALSVGVLVILGVLLVLKGLPGAL
jgi:hypothetical protein